MLLIAVAICPSGIGLAREPVQITLASPESTTKMVPGSQVTIYGFLNVPGVHVIKLRVYDVNRGVPPWKKLIGVSTQTNEAGEFMLNVEPPTGGWPEGRVRFEVRPEDWSLARASSDVRVWVPPGAFMNPDPGDVPMGNPAAVIDLANPPAVAPTIVVGQGVLVSGAFESPANESMPASNVGLFSHGKLVSVAKTIRDGQTRRYEFELHFTNTTEVGDFEYVLYRGTKATDDKKVGTFKLKVVAAAGQQQTALNETNDADLRLVVDELPAAESGAEPIVQ
jgi:hypothetical protein